MSELSTEHRLLIEARMAIATMLGKDEKCAESHLVGAIDRYLLDQMTVSDFISAFFVASPNGSWGSDGLKKPFAAAWCKAAAMAATERANALATLEDD